jgi:molybdopterin converting factor small subunit
MRVHLGGHLSWYDPRKRSWLDLAQPEPIGVLALARQLGVPEAEIAVVTVGRRAVDLATAVAADDDTVEFYPPIGGG